MLVFNWTCTKKRVRRILIKGNNLYTLNIHLKYLSCVGVSGELVQVFVKKNHAKGEGLKKIYWVDIGMRKSYIHAHKVGGSK